MFVLYCCFRIRSEIRRNFAIEQDTEIVDSTLGDSTVNVILKGLCLAFCNLVNKKLTKDYFPTNRIPKIVVQQALELFPALCCSR